ncbi:MAG: hypothetical protein IT557_03585 [Alphaproteobacteria bacterium]|nr:hypothetical protein [Alphaproteobacteria bacterium]
MASNASTTVRLSSWKVRARTPGASSTRTTSPSPAGSAVTRWTLRGGRLRSAAALGVPARPKRRISVPPSCVLRTETGAPHSNTMRP